MAGQLKKWSENRSKKNMTEQKALQNAMKRIDTFEGNLRAEHTESKFVFVKIRG